MKHAHLRGNPHIREAFALAGRRVPTDSFRVVESGLPVPGSRRFTVVVADRRTGVYRRFGLKPWPALAAVALLFLLPVLIGMGLRWSAVYEISALRAATERLDLENRNFRAATGELTTQLQSLQAVVSELGARAAVDSHTARAMERLPAVVKSGAVGGPILRLPSGRSLFPASPGGSGEDTFGVLRDLLHTLESHLQVVQPGVERRQALASATPSIWPARGWMNDGFGPRRDPFSGGADYHPGLDISADRGDPVIATANGTISSAQRAGAYGNMVVIDHGFGISTRYAHLDSFRVKPGDVVRRGDVIGMAGTTGRSTGTHLHYEVLVSGRHLNPLRFLLNRARP
jgi:murein DD-endopeptidase MepM/ murein hydrolase activator NlpD